MKPEAVVTPSQMGGPFGRRSPHLRGPYSMPNHRQAAIFNLTGDIRGEARIVERAFGIGSSALTEAVALLAQNLDAKTA